VNIQEIVGNGNGFNLLFKIIDDESRRNEGKLITILFFKYKMKFSNPLKVH